MTPTLTGRIQTRIMLQIFIGIPISIILGIFMGSLSTAFFLLCISLVVGLLFDPIHSYLQHKTWDDEWPVLMIILSGLLELFITLFILQIVTSIPFFSNYLIPPSFPLVLFYGLMWLIILIISLSVIHIALPYRRFRGGKIH